jgi:hypothetical protein
MPKHKDDRTFQKFATLPVSERRFPESLRLLFHDLVVDQFEGKPAVAAQQLRSILRKAGSQEFRRRPRALTTTSVIHVAKGRQPISFSQLDAMARTFDIPLGLMLLFTRARSEIGRQGRSTDALRVLTAVRAALYDLERHIEEGANHHGIDEQGLLDHNYFKSFCDQYLDAFHQTLL